MENNMQTYPRHSNKFMGFVAGLIMGGLTGAGVMLLLAPQSGEETRSMFQHKGIELRDQAAKSVESVEGAVAQIRVKARHVTADVLQKAEDLQKHGQQIIDETKERLATLVEAS